MTTLERPLQPVDHGASSAAPAEVHAAQPAFRSLVFSRFPARLTLPVILFAGLLVFLPSILCPFLLDDYLHAAMISGRFPAHRSPLDLYNFIDDEVRGAFFRSGALPWWASHEIQLKFFRPLSSAILFLDHSIVKLPLAMHIHSVAWWVAAVLAARRLFRRLLAEKGATIALIVFALAPCHAFPLAWLANREALISLALGTFALDEYLRFRAGGEGRRGLVAGVLFALALLSGEYAMCFGGYVLAFELLLRDRRLGARALGLLPFAVPAAAYLACRAALGYGARSSGFYTDPFVDLVAFLKLLPWRFSALVGDVWLSPDADSYRPRWVIFPVVLLAAALIGPAIVRALRALSSPSRPRATFLVVGSLLALLPVASVVPSSRLLGVSMLGVAAAVGSVLEHAWFAGFENGGARAPRYAVNVALLLAFVHIVRGPVLALVTAGAVRGRALAFRADADLLREKLAEGDADGREKRVVAVRATEEVFFLPFILSGQGLHPPPLIALTNAPHVLLLAKDEHSVEALGPHDRNLIREGERSLFFDDSTVMRRGNMFRVAGVRVVIDGVGADGPTSARFIFDEDIASDDLAWVTTGSGGIRAIDPPRPGFGTPVDP